MLFLTSWGVLCFPLIRISPDFMMPPSSRQVIMSSRDVLPQPENILNSRHSHLCLCSKKQTISNIEPEECIYESSKLADFLLIFYLTHIYSSRKCSFFFTVLVEQSISITLFNKAILCASPELPIRASICPLWTVRLSLLMAVCLFPLISHGILNSDSLSYHGI